MADQQQSNETEEMKEFCGNCAYYTKRPCNDDYCGKTGKTVAYLAVKDCWTGHDDDDSNDLTIQNKMNMEVLEKTCPSCGKTLPASEFYKNSSTKDGLSYYCKECHKKSMKKGKTQNVTRAEIVGDAPEDPELTKIKDLAARYEKELFDAKATIENIKVKVEEQAQLLDKRGKEITALVMERDSVKQQLTELDHAFEGEKSQREYFQKESAELQEALAEMAETPAEMVAKLRAMGFEVKATRTITEEL